jgi:threonine aldolase
MDGVKKTVKTAGFMVMATLLAKFLGMYRDVLFAALYGTSEAAIAYQTASRIPLLFFDIALKQNNLAYKLRNELIKLGVEFEIDSPTNQLFPIFKKEVVKRLEKDIMFELWTEYEDKQCIRFVTNFLLEESDILKTIDIIRNAL